MIIGFGAVAEIKSDFMYSCDVKNNKVVIRASYRIDAGVPYFVA